LITIYLFNRLIIYFNFYLKQMLVLPYLVSCLDKCLSSLFLNWLIVDEFTTASGKLVNIFSYNSFSEIIFSYVIPYTPFLVVYADTSSIFYGARC